MKMKEEGNEKEVKVKMRWKLLTQDAKRGTQKKKEGENTNTWNLAQNGQTLERQGKRKAKADGHETRPAEGGEDGRLNQPTTAKPTPTSARAEHNLPEERRTQEHMR